MTDYLFFDHLHFILRKRFLWFLMGRACPLMLRLLREANFEVILLNFIIDMWIFMAWSL